MAALTQDQPVPAQPRLGLKEWLAKAAVLALLAALLGLAQGWMAERYYGPQWVAGFHTGVVQGALMPAALPGLLFGKDLPIYAQVNTGRGYKLGFIIGINACGVIFFGAAFWRPRMGKAGN